jgi:hypothetical protein
MSPDDEGSYRLPHLVARLLLAKVEANRVLPSRAKCDALRVRRGIGEAVEARGDFLAFERDHCLQKIRPRSSIAP